MGIRHTQVFAGVEELGEAAARLWLQSCREARARNAAQTSAICGGRGVAAVFRAFVQTARREPAAVEGARFFWADERCVPPTSGESNFAGAKRLLLDPLGLDPRVIHRVEGELPPTEAVARINAVVEREVAAGPDGRPVFDFVLLSMGEDGHVASLFPGGVENDEESRRTYRFVLGSKPPPERITLSYAAIAAARRVLVLVSEPDKAPALAESFRTGGLTPLARLIGLRAETDVLTAFRFPRFREPAGITQFLLNKRTEAVFNLVVELLVCCVSWKAERPCLQRERYSSGQKSRWLLDVRVRA